jgi:putative SOS response-associated peptidase YedK
VAARGRAKQKEKYWVRLPGENMLYMAGLYRYYSDADGTPKPRFVILTTGANEDISVLHDRMRSFWARTRGKPGSTETTSDAAEPHRPEVTLERVS